MEHATTRLEHAEDSYLVRLAQEGCRAAFDVLARRYRAGVSLTARQIVGEAGRAEDVAQDALLIAFRALPSLADPERFAAWLGAITRHRARRVARRESRYVPLEPAHLDYSLDYSQAAAVPDPEGLTGILTEAFGEIGPEYQTVLRLRYWEEWSVAQIAAFLSLPVTTVKWRLHYGREVLRRRLTRHEKDEHEKEEETDGKFSV